MDYLHYFYIYRPRMHIFQQFQWILKGFDNNLKNIEKYAFSKSQNKTF